MTVDLTFHWEMLSDHDRNAAYRTAIQRETPGLVVYDLGAGIGPMSYYALKAGARRVYGFEIDRDAQPYLRRLAARFPHFLPLAIDVLREPLPQEPPDVVICEMWSAWLSDWPMIRVLNRVLRRSPRAHVIPRSGYHTVQLVQARHRAGLPLDFVPGTEVAVFGEPFDVAEMSLPALACVTDFQDRIGPLRLSVPALPLTTGTVNAVRLSSYEEVFAGHMLPRIGTRSDQLLRWVSPVSVRRGRRVRVRIQHRWDRGLRVWIE